MRSVCPDHVSGKKENIMRELVEGKEYASELKLLFQNPDDTTTPSSAQQLVAQILRSFSQSISFLTSSAAQIPAIPGQSGSQLGATSGNGRREDESGHSRKRSPPPPGGRRGCYKRRTGENTWTTISHTMEDDHAWRKYGQKEILNSKFPRSYFRCTRKHDQGCKAIKQVQRMQENPEMFKTTYIGLHTCKDNLKAPEMVTDSGNWGSSYMLPTESNRPLMSSSSSTRSPTIKQEYPNKEEETSLSEVTDDLWSDFKDYELSEPLNMSSTMDFGVDHSVGFGTDHHLRFQY